MVIICEVSFEVCNKVGGIYTVVSSKVPYLQKHSSRYIAIGPWLNDVSATEFTQFDKDDVPKDIQLVFDILYKKGIYCTYGKWNIRGGPETILINYKTLLSSEYSSYLKTMYWNHFKIDSLYAGFDFEEPLCFSSAVGMFLEEFSRLSNSKIIAQLHEWMSGFAGLYLKIREKEHAVSFVSSVFTTHATMLGRSLSSSGVDVRKLPKTFDSDSSARDLGVIAKHSTEKACALHLDAFTTVSSITAKEATLFFGVKPVLTNNGIDENIFPKGKNLIIKQNRSKEQLLQLLSEKFPQDISFKDYAFFYTSGRFEFHNKGFDSILSSLKLLNDSNEKIAFFFLVPCGHYSLKKPSFSVSTHDLYEEALHPIVKMCSDIGLDNTGSVKIILHPIYLGSDEDMFFNQSYYSTVMGFDLGVFPSSYEPWGYTPMECLATGVPSITSNETGFGNFCKKKKYKDIHIVTKGEKEVTQLYDFLKQYASLTEEERLEKTILAKELSKKFSWEVFIKQYIDVYKKLAPLK